MNTKTALKTVLATVAGLSLTMAAVAFAQDGHMGGTQNTASGMGGMMGQTTQQTTTGHGGMGMGMGSSMREQTNHGSAPATTDHHANSNQKTNDYPCHGDTKTKG